MKTDPLDDTVSTLVLLPGMDGTGELFSRFLHALPGRLAGPHFLLQTQPAAAAREVLRFLASPLCSQHDPEPTEDADRC